MCPTDILGKGEDESETPGKEGVWYVLYRRCSRLNGSRSLLGGPRPMSSCELRQLKPQNLAFPAGCRSASTYNRK